ncbi:30S ribosomal protein S17 [Candidatus Izimaplasma bacterium HR1]|jgi:small subunit ribosomal protein S17|uniref:30S ribosomal protein S17 n=1 Tax=Candidatus Izimoplasma sp. HR1 TaxID=1541959 RepID=UPI0004F8778F|nr:30S ribosomal protein S17 [Candidatus Izimaplasma bacterium HR1]
MERNKRRILTGIVVSASGDKTISVSVESYRKHRLYGKRVKQSKKFAAHDEANLAKVGDVVKVMETRPLSKTKRFRLLEVVESKS